MVDTNDFIFSADTELRYLGHDRAIYGFVLESTGLPEPKVFVLPFPPQSIEQTEEAAVTVVPTQNAGKFVENHGSVIKDIVITGTTGWLPRAAIKDSPDAVNLHNGQTGYSRSVVERTYASVSGYAVFHKLRSLFREYWELNQSADKSIRANTFLTFVNTKDAEYWVVEPTSFRTQRSAKNPMGYVYSIQMKTLHKGTAPLDAQLSSSSGSASPEYDDAELTAEAIDVLATSTATVSEGVGVSTPFTKKLYDASALITDGATRIATEMRGASESVLSPVRALLVATESVCYAFENLVSGAASFVNIPGSLVEYARDAVDAVYAAAEAGVTEIPATMALNLVKIKQSLAYIAARPEVFVSSVQRKWGSVATIYKEFGLMPPEYSSLASTTTTCSCLNGEDPWSLALRVCGDASKGFDVIVLNDLRYPYFSDTRLPGTKSPGDLVLVPSGSASSEVGVGPSYRSDSSEFAGVLTSATSYSITVDPLHNVDWVTSQWVGAQVEVTSGAGSGQTRTVVSSDSSSVTVVPAWSVTPGPGDTFSVRFVVAASRAVSDDVYLRDVAVDTDFDIALASDGDFYVSAGEGNFNQALTLKLATEQKELPMHPYFGLALPTGAKATVSSLLLYRINAERTLLSDSRVASVSNVRIGAEDGTVRMQARVSPVGTLAAKTINTVF